MHFVCPRCSGFPKTERIATESKVSATQYPFSTKETGRNILPSDVGLNVEKFCPTVTSITEPMDQWLTVNKSCKSLNCLDQNSCWWRQHNSQLHTSVKCTFGMVFCNSSTGSPWLSYIIHSCKRVWKPSKRLTCYNGGSTHIKVVSWATKNKQYKWIF